MNLQMSFFSMSHVVQKTCVSLFRTGTYSAAVKMAQTLMPACICSLINPGDTARGHMSRRGQSILSSMTSKIVTHLYICLPRYQHEVVTVVFLPTLPCRRFEFDVSLQEVQSRKLDVSVKNNKMFYTRERKDIGMVGNATYDSLSFAVEMLSAVKTVSWVTQIHPQYGLMLKMFLLLAYITKPCQLVMH